MSKIFVVGGGTGGHLFPAIGLAQALIKRKISTLLITDTRCKKYLPKDLKIPYKIFHIGLLNSNWITRCLTACRMLLATIRCTFLIHKNKPIAIISFGGYTSLPILIAARIKHIPVILHEENSVLGKVNQIFAGYAKFITTNFEHTHKIPAQYNSKVIVVGNPVRQSVQYRKSTKKIGFTILVIAGSQAARKFDEFIPEAIKILVEKSKEKIKLLEQVTPSNYESVTKNLSTFAKSHRNFEFETAVFFENIESLYNQADIVIARSGASTIAELVTLAKPSILIPLPTSAQNHQLFNALELQNKGACILLEQKNITPQILAQKILHLINTPDDLNQISENLIKMQQDSSSLLIDLLLKNFNTLAITN